MLGTKVSISLFVSENVLVYGPESFGQRIVEVHTRDGLHVAPVTVAQAAPVNRLHFPYVGVAVVRQWNFDISMDSARHARRPQQFVPELLIGELMNVADCLQRFPGARESRCHELEQGFRKIGRDVAIGQGRAEPHRMRCLREVARRVYSQGFLLDAPQTGTDRIVGACLQSAEALLECQTHNERFTISAGNPRNRAAYVDELARRASVE